jgi:hypothetical protein
VPDPNCPSGYRYDTNGGKLAGQCVPVNVAIPDLGISHVEDMAMMSTPDAAWRPEDMAQASPPDMAVGDMAISCTHVGEACTVGTGACMASGKINCAIPGQATCDATPGTPDSAWHTSAAPNGSWDWDCDGLIEYQYPNGDTTQPLNINDNRAECTTKIMNQATCLAPAWFTALLDTSNVKGATVQHYNCAWDGAACKFGPAGPGYVTEVTEGIH